MLAGAASAPGPPARPPARHHLSSGCPLFLRRCSRVLRNCNRTQLLLSGAGHLRARRGRQFAKCQPVWLRPPAPVRVDNIWRQTGQPAGQLAGCSPVCSRWRRLPRTTSPRVECAFVFTAKLLVVAARNYGAGEPASRRQAAEPPSQRSAAQLAGRRRRQQPTANISRRNPLGFKFKFGPAAPSGHCGAGPPVRAPARATPVSRRQIRFALGARRNLAARSRARPPEVAPARPAPARGRPANPATPGAPAGPQRAAGRDKCARTHAKWALAPPSGALGRRARC